MTWITRNFYWVWTIVAVELHHRGHHVPYFTHSILSCNTNHFVKSTYLTVNPPALSWKSGYLFSMLANHNWLLALILAFSSAKACHSSSACPEPGEFRLVLTSLSDGLWGLSCLRWHSQLPVHKCKNSRMGGCGVLCRCHCLYLKSHLSRPWRAKCVCVCVIRWCSVVE